MRGSLQLELGDIRKEKEGDGAFSSGANPMHGGSSTTLSKGKSSKRGKKQSKRM